MDRSFIIKMQKELLVATRTQPTTFFVEQRGVPLEKMATLSNDGPCSVASCFLVGWKTVKERHWNLNDIIEVGFTTIEKSQGKEELIIAFCVPGEMVCTEQRMEIQRDGEHITLLDSGAETTDGHDLLLSFVTGMASGALTRDIATTMEFPREGL